MRPFGAYHDLSKIKNQNLKSGITLFLYLNSKIGKMKKLLFTLSIVILFGCAPKQVYTPAVLPNTDTRTQPLEYLDESTFLLKNQSTDSTYAFSSANPVKVGGFKDFTGAMNEKRFLNALLGLNGEPVKYVRAGSCCFFETPNGAINNTGLLDLYIVYVGTDTLDIYINAYDNGDLFIPVGFTAKH